MILTDIDKALLKAYEEIKKKGENTAVGTINWIKQETWKVGEKTYYVYFYDERISKPKVLWIDDK